MLYGLLPVFVLIAGLLLWAWGPGEPTSPSKKVGEWMFVCGLLAVCIAFAGHLVKLL